MMSPTLPTRVLDTLTPAQVRVWCALVLRHKSGRVFMPQKELAAAASVNPKTWATAVRLLESHGLVTIHPRFVPAGWDGDPQHVVGVRDPWHTIRLADDYQLHECASSAHNLVNTQGKG